MDALWLIKYQIYLKVSWIYSFVSLFLDVDVCAHVCLEWSSLTDTDSITSFHLVIHETLWLLKVILFDRRKAALEEAYFLSGTYSLLLLGLQKRELGR